MINYGADSPLTIYCHTLPQNNRHQLLKRRGHTTVLYKGRYLIIFGGCDMRGNFLSDVLRFDLQTCQWSEISSFGEIPCGRYGHSACISNDCYMYIYGGYFMQKTNELSCLNLETGEWIVLQCKGELPPGTDGHSMVIYKNELIIFGGRKKNWVSTNLIHILNLQTLEWKRVVVEETNVNSSVDVPCARTDHCDIFHDGKLYIQGGYDDGGQFLGRRNDLYAFDVKNQSWTQLTDQCIGNPPPEMSTHRASCLKINGKHYMIMVAGWDNYKRHRNDVYGLELESLKWFRLPSLSFSIFHERRHFGMVKIPKSVPQSEYLRENDLIVFGGCSDTQMLSDICVLRLSDSSSSSNSTSNSTINSNTLSENCGDSNGDDHERVVELWKQLMNNHSNCLTKIVEFGNCYDLLEWSLVNNSQWNQSISKKDLLKQALVKYWNLRNRQLVMNGNPKILKLIPKDLTSLSIISEHDDEITIQQLKNTIHQLTDVFSTVDPHENVVWTSFPKINSLIGIVKVNFSVLEMKPNNNSYSFYMGLHSTSFEEYPIITSIIATSRKIKQVDTDLHSTTAAATTARETFILFDPFIGSLIFSDKIMNKMIHNFKRIMQPMINSNSSTGSIIFNDILTVLSRTDSAAEQFNRKSLSDLFVDNSSETTTEIIDSHLQQTTNANQQ